jgi:hypothetical protein
MAILPSTEDIKSVNLDFDVDFMQFFLPPKTVLLPRVRA